MAAEDEDNEDCHTGWAFNNQEILIDICNTNHAFNQSKNTVLLTDVDVLCDNQSTSDIIKNKAFLNNIRECKWTLVLPTQSGIFCINKIADLPGVGTVWYYPEGAANILSWHRLVVNSGWSIQQDSDIYHQTGNTDDRLIRCVTSEGVKCEFRPTQEGLHVMDCKSYLRNGNNCIFCKTITDKGTNNGQKWEFAIKQKGT